MRGQWIKLIYLWWCWSGFDDDRVCGGDFSCVCVRESERDGGLVVMVDDCGLWFGFDLV